MELAENIKKWPTDNLPDWLNRATGLLLALGPGERKLERLLVKEIRNRLHTFSNSLGKGTREPLGEHHVEDFPAKVLYRLADIQLVLAVRCLEGNLQHGQQQD